MAENKSIHVALIACLLSCCGERRSNESGEDGPGGQGGSVGVSSSLPHRRDISQASGSDQPGGAATGVSVESLLARSDQELIGFFQILDESDPARSCEIILKMQLSKQKLLLSRSVAKLGLVDPLAALAIVDSLQAGNLRKECIWSLGRVIKGEAWKDLGALLPKLFLEDQIALVTASNASGAKAIKSIVQALEENGIGGEPLAVAKSKMAYLMGSTDPAGIDSETASVMSKREKEAYINGIISQDPKLALNTTLRLAKSDPEIISEVAGQLVAALFEKDSPNDTISLVSNLDLEPKE